MLMTKWTLDFSYLLYCEGLQPSSWLMLLVNNKCWRRFHSRCWKMASGYSIIYIWFIPVKLIDDRIRHLYSMKSYSHSKRRSNFVGIYKTSTGIFNSLPFNPEERERERVIRLLNVNCGPSLVETNRFKLLTTIEAFPEELERPEGSYVSFHRQSHDVFWTKQRSFKRGRFIVQVPNVIYLTCLSMSTQPLWPFRGLLLFSLTISYCNIF